jgi:hypothetical protein
MAQVPATQQPHPELSQGAFFMGACFCAAIDPTDIGMPDIAIEQGIEAGLPGLAQTGATPARHKPRATRKAVIRRPKNRGIEDMVGPAANAFKRWTPLTLPT